MGLKKQFKKYKIAGPAIRRILGGGKMRQKLFCTIPENIYKSFTLFSGNYKTEFLIVTINSVKIMDFDSKKHENA